MSVLGLSSDMFVTSAMMGLGNQSVTSEVYDPSDMDAVPVMTETHSSHGMSVLAIMARFGAFHDEMTIQSVTSDVDTNDVFITFVEFEAIDPIANEVRMFAFEIVSPRFTR